MEWLLRLKNALDLLEERMDQRLEIEEIAKAAYVSSFHFQRMFHMLTGMTVAEYTRKRRLTLAAQELAMTSAKVVDVALKYGYDSPEAFAKAFRKIHGVAPSEARNPGVSLKAFPRIHFQLSLKGDKDMDYRIVDKEAFTVVGKILETTCREQEHMQEIPKFWRTCLEDGTDEKLSALGVEGMTYGICLPMESEKEKLTYMIACQAAPEAADASQGYSWQTIPASTWAVFNVEGAMPNSIQSVFGRIFQEWFPATGYEHAGAPEIEAYPPGDAYSDDYRCEIWIPIVKK